MSPIYKNEDTSNLVPLALSGDRRAVARLLSLVEARHPEGQKALDALFPFSGKAHRIGITGAPGSGKSSLVSQLALGYRKSSGNQSPHRVAIVAVDPTSPFTGGALLGDRIRMRDLAGDEGIFIRSMATRGALGGLAQTTADFVQVLDAVGYDVIFIETVGSGQTEVDIARLAQTVLVVQAPNMGDDIQASKAGLLEIADILVVNKSDLPGAESTIGMLEAMLAIAGELNRRSDLEEDSPSLGQAASQVKEGWLPPVIATTAITGKGIDTLIAAIDRHDQFLQKSGQRQEREKQLLTAEMEKRLEEALLEQWHGSFDVTKYHEIMKSVIEHRISPQTALKLFLGTP